MALTASTIRPVQRFGETNVGLVIFDPPQKLENASPPLQKSGQEKDEKQEQQHLGDQCRGRSEYCKAQHSADERDDQEHQCVVKHDAPPAGQ